MAVVLRPRLKGRARTERTLGIITSSKEYERFSSLNVLNSAIGPNCPDKHSRRPRPKTFATRTPAAKDAAKSLSMSSQKLFIRRRRQLFRLPISLSILPPPPYRSIVIVSPQENRCCLGTESGGRASTQPALTSKEKRGASSPHLGNKGNGKNTQTQERRRGTDESCFSKPDVVGAQASEITEAKRVEGGRLLFALFKYFFVTWMPLKWDRKK